MQVPACFSKFLHMISNYTNQQIVIGNNRSNLAAKLVSWGPLRPHPVGSTESDMMWEVGLIAKFVIVSCSYPVED